ncbi:hypothetical protein L0V05_11190 [Tabrizicola sp. J26]|uniref:hypothetical protein n=1 Tax=Alitabrizicola rongguiensis TaxID=2909234 RepID=UPI001F267995|nr:hypothetical protein [Tabrizicola rongguiensis]MCF1709384.1 hypothetical protein [Tabrizicola rongguiensis]
MSQVFHAALNLLMVFGAAVTASAAAKAHRQPVTADLRRLGVPQDAFARIRL